MTARAGLALFPQDGADAETLFENSLAAMEDARSSQTDSYKFHSGTLKLRALQRNEAELELKTALDREQFSVDYLPAVNAKTGRVAGVEALLRWPKAIFGTQRTQKVVALAEHTGLIVPIGEWVMKKSIGDLKRWSHGDQPPGSSPSISSLRCSSGLVTARIVLVATRA